VVAWTPAGSGLSTVTANVMLPEPPAGRLAMVTVQVEPAEAPSAQDQTVGALAVVLKVVLAGTVSVMTTPVASWLP